VPARGSGGHRPSRSSTPTEHGRTFATSSPLSAPVASRRRGDWPWTGKQMTACAGPCPVATSAARLAKDGTFTPDDVLNARDDMTYWNISRVLLAPTILSWVSARAQRL
jgi:hypothetical protein